MSTVSNQYNEDSAGAVALSNVPTATPQELAGAVLKRIQQGVAGYDSVLYIYVLDATARLCGVVSIKELLQLADNAVLSDHTQRDIISVQVGADQEAAAQIALLYSIKSVPVIDAAGTFVGVLVSDQIMDILQHESLEDTLRLAGMQVLDDNHRHTVLSGSWTMHFWRRLPWLVVGLLGGVVAAVVVQQFEHILTTHVIIAAFIPAVVYIADAVGSQTQTIYVRALALDANLPTKRYALREMLVNGLLAVVLGISLAVVSALTITTWQIGTLLGLAIFVTVILALCTSLLVPYVFFRCRIDPAIASGPLATIIRDVLSLFAYLLLVLWLL